ncbi:tyrosine-type recombinase/integrase [Vallitalea okinawensis]|uniref:tyrosine-type recombinase/integrase n=1 Tax=Vallitalea okinawensis TaxID=2078660 RepID=UPI0038CD94FF
MSLEDRMVIIQDNYVRANKELILKPYTKNTQKRTIHLFEDLVPILRKYELDKKKNQLQFGKYYNHNNFYFTWDDGRPFDPDYIYKSFKKSCKRLGYNELTLHDLRHFYVSVMLGRGDIPLKITQDSLGHSSAEMMGLNGHLMNDMAKKVFKGKTMGLLENHFCNPLII